MYYNRQNRSPFEQKINSAREDLRIQNAVDVLVAKVDSLENRSVKIINKVGEHEDKLEELYFAVDRVRGDVQKCLAYEGLLEYLYKKVESAPSVAKRRRKVTIRANGQRVEVTRND